MAWGARVWDGNGELMLDTTDMIARLVRTTIKDGTTSGSEYVAEADGKIAFVVSFPSANNTTGSAMICQIDSSGILSWVSQPAKPMIPATGETVINVYIYN